MVGSKKRYGLTVVTLLALVFTGIAAVIGIVGRTAFRPLPFSHPETLVQVTEGGNLFVADTLAATVRLVPEVEAFATFASHVQTDVAYAGATHAGSVVQTSPNYFDLLQISGLHKNPKRTRGPERRMAACDI
jgi:hypothetical protein